MKKLIKLIVFISCLFSSENFWNTHSAHIIDKGRWEIGLFQPLRYGYSNFSEFSIHPGWFLVMPNLEIKESQADFLGFITASQYKIIYPTPLFEVSPSSLIIS